MNSFLKKCIAITLLILLMLVIFTAITLKLDIKTNKPRETTTVIPKYTLTSYDGRLALFEEGYAMPVEIYDVILSELPEAEQYKINKGIKAYTDEEALKIIEDYTS